MAKKEYRSPQYIFLATITDVCTASFTYKTDEEGNDDNDVGFWSLFGAGDTIQ